MQNKELGAGGKRLTATGGKSRRRIIDSPYWPDIRGVFIGIALVGTLVALRDTPRRAPHDLRIEARDVAYDALASNIQARRHPNGRSREYILAGGLQYYTLWTRDFSMSVGGALVAREFNAVRDTLDEIFELQRHDGLLPRHVDNLNANLRWASALVKLKLPFKPPFEPWFESENGVLTIDQNLSIPWAASRYVLWTEDREFALRWLDSALRAVAFIERDFWEKGLVSKQPPYSDWEDSVQRTGRVALTNELYYLAVKGLADWSDWLGKKKQAQELTKKAESFRKRFLEFFWDESRGVLTNFEGDDRLTADANLFGVIHRILTPAQAKRAMSALRASELWQPMPGRPTTPDYTDAMKAETVLIAQTADYHDQMYWSWIAAAAAIAEHASGNCRGYRQIMHALNQQLIRDETVYEVWEKKRGTQVLVPVSRITYRSEKPFTWGAAWYLEAEARAHECAPSLDKASGAR